jgi:nicotinamidase-related amidase
MASPLKAPLSRATVHVCVDMQQLFSPDGPWATPWMGRTLPAITEIAEKHSSRTVFTRFIPPQRADDAFGQWRPYYRRWHQVTGEELDPHLLDLVDPLSRFVPPAVVVDKPVYSPFFGRVLAQLLRDRQADTVVVTGAETDVCVLATVLGAVDHGYRVVVVEDAICSSSDAGHDALMTMYRERFTEQIEVCNTERVLSSWPQT